MCEVGHLVGALEDRVNLLFDPVLMVRFISGVAIREDQVETAHVWNEDIEVTDSYFGIILHDTANSDVYRLQVTSGTLTLTLI